MKRFFVLVFVSLALTVAPSAAFAHKFVLEPDNFTVGQSEEAGVSQTFTEIIGAAEYSRYGTSYVYDPITFSVEVIYNDDTRSVISDSSFTPYDYESKSSVPEADSDSDHAQFDITKPGTVVINGTFAGTQKPDFGGGENYSHMKAFLNLTNDGMATQRFGGDEVLEVVFAEEVPEDGIKEGNAVRFKFYYKGLPLKNAPVFAAYVGAPVYEITENGQKVPVNDYLEKVTDGNGVAAFLLDHATGWFVGAFVDEAYGGGLMFSASPDEESESEGDITEFIIADGANRAEIGFPTWTKGDASDLVRDQFGIVSASNLTTAPKGSTDFLSGMENQLPGDGTGSIIDIPMDISRDGVRGATGTEQMLVLSADIVDGGIFTDMVTYLKAEKVNSPEKFFDFSGFGTWYVPYTPKLFFDNFDIAIMGKFSDDVVRDVSESFQIGIVYDEDQFDEGNITILYGTMLVDSDISEGNYSLDVTEILFPGNPNKFSLIYDGKTDDSLNFSYWLAQKSSGDSGDGGCATGATGLWGIVSLMAALFVYSRKCGVKGGK